MEEPTMDHPEEQLLNNPTAVVKKKVAWYTFIGDFFNILKAFIGTNYQALPFAFKNSGLVIGVIGVFIIACLTDYCCQLLIRCKHVVIDRVVYEEHEDLDAEEKAKLRSSLNNTVGYGDLARRAFGGKWGEFMYHLVQIAVWFTQYLTCVAYFIFIGNTIYEMYPVKIALIPLNNSTHPSALTETGSGVPMLALPNLGRYRRSVDDEDYEMVSSSLSSFSSGLGLNPDVYARKEAPELWEDLADKDYYLGSESITDMLNTTTTLSSNSTTTMASNTTTTIASNLTTTPTTTPNTTVAPTPAYYYKVVSTAPDLKILCLFPLAFFLGTSLIRRLRKIAPFSVVASVALFIGAVSVFAFLCVDFTICAKGFEWVQLGTLPLFIGQLISAYEGIGCIVPIESSMEGNQHVFRSFLHANVFIVFVVLTAFGSVGYLRYGDDVSQLIVSSIPQHTVLSLVVDATLVVSVLFTYPLQCFPVIEIVENYLFAPGACCAPAHHPHHPRRSHSIQHEEGGEEIDEDEEAENSLEASISSVVTFVPPKVPRWKRNIVRVLITLSILGIAILTRNAYAYLAAFSGALACSLLAYILPCVIHLQLHGWRASIGSTIIHVIIISAAVLASAFTLVVIFYKMAMHQMVL